MPKAIISDASCLILFEKIGALNLLAETYGNIITTPVVAAEVRFALPDWVEIRSATVGSVEISLRGRIDPGEASAIALALEIDDSTVILDDLKARKVAKEMGLDVTGTVGVLLKAKSDGVISSIRPFILAIRKTSFRLSRQLEEEAFLLAGESET